ncbi:histidine phosphatase family protein [Butyrivibrio sp. LC3010]|uniref:histidine phosphatase family protein n=1 Tax=Butyrivibrio sp. LC3010 TaxID=1280680 RepID=UPI0004024778|nr:histidine phosphatase family protein [Butyrivibrio sp. LC3010]
MKLYILRHGTTEWNNRHLIQGQTDIPLDDFGRLMAKATGEGLRKKGITFDKVYSSPLKRSVETARIVLGQQGDITDDDYNRDRIIYSQKENITDEDRQSIAEDSPQIEIITDDRLKELSFGFMDGGKVEEMTADDNSPFRFFKTAPDKYEEAVLSWRRDNLPSVIQNNSESPELLSELCERAKEFLTTVIEPMVFENYSETEGNLDEYLNQEVNQNLKRDLNRNLNQDMNQALNQDTSVLISVHGALSKALLMHIRGERNLAEFWGEGLLPNCGIAIVTLQIKNGKPDYHIDNPAAVFYDESIKAKAPKLL